MTGVTISLSSEDFAPNDQQFYRLPVRPKILKDNAVRLLGLDKR